MASNSLKKNGYIYKALSSAYGDVIIHTFTIVLIVAVSYMFTHFEGSLLTKIFFFMGTSALFTVYLSIKLIIHLRKHPEFVPKTIERMDETSNTSQQYSVEVFNRAGVQYQNSMTMRDMGMVLYTIYIMISITLCTLAWAFQTPIAIFFAVAGLVNITIYGYCSIEICARCVSLLYDFDTSDDTSTT